MEALQRFKKHFGAQGLNCSPLLFSTTNFSDWTKQKTEHVQRLTKKLQVAGEQRATEAFPHSPQNKAHTLLFDEAFTSTVRFSPHFFFFQLTNLPKPRQRWKEQGEAQIQVFLCFKRHCNHSWVSCVCCNIGFSFSFFFSLPVAIIKQYIQELRKYATCQVRIFTKWPAAPFVISLRSHPFTPKAQPTNHKGWKCYEARGLWCSGPFSWNIY